MRPTIVALSGRIASGKTSLGKLLMQRRPGTLFRTSELIRIRAEAQGLQLETRFELQEYGERLDRETEGLWVAKDLGLLIAGMEDHALVVIDAVRVAAQVDGLRGAFGRRVAHVHLTAPMDVLADRYAARRQDMDEPTDYSEVGKNATEAAVDDLAIRADVVIDTDRNTDRDVEIRCAARLGLLPAPTGPRADFVVGGQYGSEGKGNVAFHLAPEYDVLVRAGGPNAGHKVPVVPEYTHKLLPSGTLSNELADLVIAPGATIDLDQLLREIAECSVEEGRLAIDPQTFVIEDSDKAAEERVKHVIGSTASGAGAAAARRILEARLANTPYRMAANVPELQHHLRPTSDVTQDAALRGATLLVEGTQGSALSLYHGSYPHVTSRDTNVGGLLAETGLPSASVRRVILVCRTYPIRVGGDSGPMGAEIDFDTVAERAGLAPGPVNDREVGSVTGKKRRVAEFDWALLRRSAELNGATDIALTFVDYLDAANRDAYRFEQLTRHTREFVEEVELVTGAPVSLLSTGFGDGRGLIDRRPWRGTSTRLGYR